jgi:hypothetical protein
VAAALLPGLVLLAVAASTLRATWSAPVSTDLDTYAAAGATWRAGGDPYDFDALRATAGPVAVRPYVYPRAALPVLSPLADVERVPRARAWAVAQVVALAVALAAAVVTSTAPWRTAAAGALGAVVLGGAVRSAVLQGNVEPLVAGAVGLGLVAAGRGRGGGALIGLGAAFKLWPAVALAAPGDRAGRARRIGVGLGVLAVVVATELSSSRPLALLREVRRMDARGPLDPSLRALLADLLDAGVMGAVTPAWSAAVVGVGLVTAVALRRAPVGPARDALVVLAALTVLPRVQDYGMVEALVPLALASSSPAAWAGLGVGAVGVAAGWRYAAWLAVAVAWGGLAIDLGRRRRVSA